MVNFSAHWLFKVYCKRSKLEEGRGWIRIGPVMNMKTMNPDTAFDQVLYLVVIILKNYLKRTVRFCPRQKEKKKVLNPMISCWNFFAGFSGLDPESWKVGSVKNKSATLEKVHCFKWLNFYFCELENSRLFAEYFVPIGGITFSGL